MSITSTAESRSATAAAVPAGTARWAFLARVGRIGPELVGLLVVVVLLFQTTELATRAGGPGPAFFPRIVLGLVAIGLGVVCVQRLRAPEAPAAVEDHPVSWGRFGIGAAVVVAYVVGAAQVGWVPATALFLVVFLRAAGAGRLWLTIPVASALTVGLAYVFLSVVYVSLPTGVGVFDEMNTYFLDVIGIY